MGNPRLFIGSSTEGKEIADTIQLGLDYDVEATVWHQGVFGLSQGSLNSLVEASHSFDFVYYRDESIALPTDLAGVTAATFARRSDDNLQAALGARFVPPVTTAMES